ncbi:MAG: class I SAM-dependent methyltransferase [Flavobacteriales bacterium]|nr:class I SAM-dependent methyltransferase [Flavobacteriales bacterium]
MKDFVDIKPSLRFMDRYVIRLGILNAIRSSLSMFKGDLLDFGCGRMPYKEMIMKDSKTSKYVGMDIQSDLNYGDVKPDVFWDGLVMPFSDESFDVAFGTEVLEHCPDPQEIFNELYRVLRSNGVLFFTVPYIWNLHEVPHDEFRYTPFSLERMLLKAGFSDIKISATGGWHASFAQMIGLWCRRAAGGRLSSWFVSLAFYPFWKLLILKDKKPEKFREGVMMPGMYVTASKTN